MYSGVPSVYPGLRQGLGRGELLAHPEVEHLGDAVLAEEDVARLDVTVDHALLVRRVQRPAHVDGDRDRQARREEAVARQLVRE